MRHAGCAVALFVATIGFAVELGAQGTLGRLEGIITDSAHATPVVGTT